MSYDYLTPAQFKTLTGLDDAGIAAINPPDSMTLISMITLNNNTDGRFSFEIDESRLFARSTWVNYYQTDSGNYKVDNVTGSAVMNSLQSKDIVLVS